MSKNKPIKINEIEKNKYKASFFKKTPFNYCDRWCERCGYKEGCKVYQQEFTARFNHVIKGENPDDPEVFFDDIKERIKEMDKLLEKNFKKIKISLAKKKDLKKDVVMEKKIESRVVNLSLYKDAYTFTIKSSSFLKKIFFEYESSDNDFVDLEKTIEEFNWYYTFFLVKFRRALDAQMKIKLLKNKKATKFDLEDAKCSAKLSYASLFVCHRSLKKFSRECLGFKKWARDISILSKSLLEKMETKFPDMDKTKIIFHA